MMEQIGYFKNIKFEDENVKLNNTYIDITLPSNTALIFPFLSFIKLYGVKLMEELLPLLQQSVSS